MKAAGRQLNYRVAPDKRRFSRSLNIPRASWATSGGLRFHCCYHHQQTFHKLLRFLIKAF